jgi:endonuclease III
MVLDKKGKVCFDSRHELAGRGCHLCPDPACLAAALKARAFSRAFRKKVPDAAAAGLAAQFVKARSSWIAAVAPRKRTSLITSRLEAAYGEPCWQGRENPLDSLVLTILSQSTNDRNRDLAFSRLRDQFPNWEAVCNAETEAIAGAIRPAGLANQKSSRIRDILRWIRATYGTFDLHFLCEQDPHQVRETFLQLKGVGIKTISVVLMVSCGADIFPVDTHVHRLCQRLGLVPEGVSAEKTHALMQPIVPAGKSYSLHMNFLQLGRTVCLARKPRCGECPVALWCPSSNILHESE